MFVVPAAVPAVTSALSNPVARTAAMAGFELVHVTWRPANGSPFLFFTVAVNCIVASGTRPTGAAGATTTAAGSRSESRVFLGHAATLARKAAVGNTKH